MPLKMLPQLCSRRQPSPHTMKCHYPHFSVCRMIIPVTFSGSRSSECVSGRSLGSRNFTYSTANLQPRFWMLHSECHLRYRSVLWSKLSKQDVGATDWDLPHGHCRFLCIDNLQSPSKWRFAGRIMLRQCYPQLRQLQCPPPHGRAGIPSAIHSFSRSFAPTTKTKLFPAAS